jgi:hypothetical protein
VIRQKKEMKVNHDSQQGTALISRSASNNNNLGKVSQHQNMDTRCLRLCILDCPHCPTFIEWEEALDS